MSTLTAWLVGVGATLVAAVLATADSALLAFHAAEASPARRTTRSRNASARTARCRWVASWPFITAGAAMAEALPLAAVVRQHAHAARGVDRGRHLSFSPRASVARLATRIRPGRCTRLAPLTNAVSTVLSPAVAFGAMIDRALHAIIPPPPRRRGRPRRRTPSNSPRSSPPKPTSRRRRRS